MTIGFSDLQLDALREVGNIGSGTAATALSELLGRHVDLDVPKALALPVADAVEALGDPDEVSVVVVLPVDGDVPGILLLVFSPESGAVLCRLLGVELESEFGLSALGEIGNVLGCAYLGALGAMTGIDFTPDPPQVVRDLLGALASSVLVATVGESDIALVLDSNLSIEDEPCGFACVFVPTAAGVYEVLSRLGLGT